MTRKWKRLRQPLIKRKVPHLGTSFSTELELKNDKKPPSGGFFVKNSSKPTITGISGFRWRIPLAEANHYRPLESYSFLRAAATPRFRLICAFIPSITCWPSTHKFKVREASKISFKIFMPPNKLMAFHWFYRQAFHKHNLQLFCCLHLSPMF